MRIVVLFSFWLALVWPLGCGAENTGDLIETLSTGQMNWTRGVLVAKGRAAAQDNGSSGQKAQDLVDMAREAAKANILTALGDVRIDDNYFLATILAEKQAIATSVREMAAAAEVIQQQNLPGGGLEITLQFSLLGGFSQLILPSDIQQVEPITAINNRSQTNADSLSGPAALDPEVYSGLIVDARGIGARPALVPVLVDEAGKEVYGPDFVSREYAVQNGVCGYVRTMAGLQQLPRVAPNPLMLKGLRTFGANRCNIVISNADAFKLRDVSSNLHFLKQCRVLIVLD